MHVYRAFDTLSTELIVKVLGCIHYLQLVRCRRVSMPDL